MTADNQTPEDLPVSLHADLALQAAEEAAAARHERIERLRRGSIWFLAVMLLAVLAGLMIGRVVHGQIVWNGVAPKREASAAPRVLEVLAQQQGDGLTLQLLLERPVAYQRAEEAGAVSLRLPGLRLVGGAQSGRLQSAGRSLSWRVEVRGADVQVLLVGLSGALVVRDRLEPAGERWRLKVEASLSPPGRSDPARPAGG